MDINAIIEAVGSWSVEDRLRLMEEIWDGHEERGQELELTEESKAELDRRLDALDRKSNDVVAWETVEARARARFRN